MEAPTDRSHALNCGLPDKASELIEGTRRGGGCDAPPEQRRTDVRILVIFEAVASVRVDAGDWIDYIHLARVNGGWRVVNVLWEMRSRPQSRTP